MNLTKYVRLLCENGLYLLLIVGTIFSSTTVWCVNNQKFTLEVTILSVLVFLAGAFLFIEGGRLKIPSVKLIFLFSYLMMMAIFLKLRMNGQTNGMINFLFLFPCYFLIFSILNQKQIKKLMHVFVLTMTVLGVLSVILFFLWQMGRIRPDGMVLLHWSKPPKWVPSFHGIQFMAQAGRNTGIFPEAPVYNYLLFPALLCNELFVKYRPRLINTLLIVTMITSTSTTSYIALAIYLFYKLSKDKSSSSFKRFLKFFVVFAALIAAVIFIRIVFLKKLDSHSGEVRSAKMLNEISLFLESPLIGHGIGTVSGTSNSIIALLAEGGIFLWSIYYFPMFNLFLLNTLQRKKIDYCMMIHIFIFAVSSFFEYTFGIVLTAFMWNLLLDKFCGRDLLEHNSELKIPALKKIIKEDML